MADKVLESILVEVKEAKIFSILLDETPDAAHQEQVTFCGTLISSVLCRNDSLALFRFQKQIANPSSSQ